MLSGVAATIGSMTSASDESSMRPPFAGATPSQIRDSLTPEDAESFERHWRALMTQATTSLDLTEVHEALDAWRRTARLTSELGHDGYRAMLTGAEERLRTGERAPGAVSWDELKVDLGLADR